MREICLPPLFPKLSAKSTGGGEGRDKRQRDGWESCLLACSWLGRGGGRGGYRGWVGAGGWEGRRGGDVWARPLCVLSRDKQVVTGTSLQPLWGGLGTRTHPSPRQDRPTDPLLPHYPPGSLPLLFFSPPVTATHYFSWRPQSLPCALPKTKL